MDEEATIQFQIGALIRSHLRTMLEGERFGGSSIRWMEDKRWTTSIFSIRGKRADVEAIDTRVKHWMMCIGASK